MLFSNSQFSFCLITPCLLFYQNKDILIQQLIISCPVQGFLHCCFQSWRTQGHGLKAQSIGNFYWETLKKQHHPGQPEEITSETSSYFAFGSILTVSSPHNHVCVVFIWKLLKSMILKVLSEVRHGRIRPGRWTCGSTVCVYIFTVYLYLWIMVFQALLIERWISAA